MPATVPTTAPTSASTTTYDVHGTFRLPDLLGPPGDGAGVAGVEELPARTARTTYVDSTDLRLARAGVTLQHVDDGTAARWVVDLPTTLGGPVVRPARAANAPPAELLDLLSALHRGAPLSGVAALRSVRTTRLLLDADGYAFAELHDETVSLMAGRRVHTRFRQVQLHRPSDGAADGTGPTEAVRALLLAQGARVADDLPLIVRVLGPLAAGEGDVAPPPAVSPRSPAGDLVVWSLRTGLARLVIADVGVRRGLPDAVHQVRVACRRLRSDLRTFSPLLDDERVPLLRAELAWLAGELGAARDLEVLRARIARTATSDPVAPLDDVAVATLIALLARDEDEAKAHALAALRSPRYVALLDLLTAAAREPVLAPLAAQPTDDVVPALVRAPWLHLVRRAGQLDAAGADDAWHRARILAKRARYAAEAAEPALGPPARRTARAAAALQELLGEHQDAATAAERILVIVAASRPDLDLAVTAGRLVERERSAVRRVRRDFPERWRVATAKRNTAWLRE